MSSKIHGELKMIDLSVLDDATIWVAVSFIFHNSNFQTNEIPNFR